MALVEGCKHSLEITVPVAEVEQETERVVAELQKKVRLPGFRPGLRGLGLGWPLAKGAAWRLPARRAASS